ncbi:hypothetical protein DXF96_08895 [Heyndrickxia coagulans]|nr:hypothetical protein CIW84_14695 [Heyndrickxia coagulans]AVD55208.1 hypothetical protein C3766_03205 [Heyndrickxia coagulans]AWP36080.1 hypothetical protein CYJ15_03350 [Heyndrickxia coagulans]KGB30543.1 hypothetical protein IE89_04235 [Heyndrickxia coagulans]KXT21925.1 hypothetical protein UZ35_01635 [Heyndrickxia coagulans]
MYHRLKEARSKSQAKGYVLRKYMGSSVLPYGRADGSSTFHSIYIKLFPVRISFFRMVQQRLPVFRRFSNSCFVHFLRFSASAGLSMPLAFVSFSISFSFLHLKFWHF